MANQPGTDQRPSTPQQHAIFTGTLAVAVAEAKLSFGFMQNLNGSKGLKKKVIIDTLRALEVAEVSPEPHALIEKYYREIYGQHLNLWGLEFPQKEGFDAQMVVPEEMDDEDWIARRIAKRFSVNFSTYKTRIADNIDRVNEQKRPQGLYVFAHRGGDEPDKVHLGKSYDDAMAQKMTFLNPKEYLLASGFHRFVKNYFMDRKGWTRTSSLWSDGYLVDGYWSDADAKLYLSIGFRDGCYPDCGPREAVLA
ncbi:MAG: hypothetical protein Q7R65_04150 [bacterium]|nr:hypothetical protein [bacterium]